MVGEDSLLVGELKIESGNGVANQKRPLQWAAAGPHGKAWRGCLDELRCSLRCLGDGSVTPCLPWELEELSERVLEKDRSRPKFLVPRRVANIINSDGIIILVNDAIIISFGNNRNGQINPQMPHSLNYVDQWYWQDHRYHTSSRPSASSCLTLSICFVPWCCFGFVFLLVVDLFKSSFRFPA